MSIALLGILSLEDLGHLGNMSPPKCFTFHLLKKMFVFPCWLQRDSMPLLETDMEKPTLFPTSRYPVLVDMEKPTLFPTSRYPVLVTSCPCWWLSFAFLARGTTYFNRKFGPGHVASALFASHINPRTGSMYDPGPEPQRRGQTRVDKSKAGLTFPRPPS